MEESLQRKGQDWAVKGAGGKGGDAPKEDPDSLRSKATASLLALFCEGEIQGFANSDPRKSIYLDDTPLVGKDGKENFEGVEIEFASGTQGQSSLNGFDEIRIEQSVGTKLTKDLGRVSVTTTSSDLDRINVRMGIASLFIVEEDDGDVKGTEVEFNIRIIDSVGTTIVNDNQSISGKSRGPYDVEFNYTLSGTGPWTVKVRRKTDDPIDLKVNNDLYLKAIVGIIQETLRYPNSALIGVKVSSEFFSSVPAISAELKGMKIKVPSNYNSSTGNYSGVWNGTFRTEYNNNPVWVFYDLLTNRRYGCGEFIDSDDIDVYSLLPIAKYCDERVSNGRGGREKRFTFNAYINNRGDAYEVLNSLAAAFRGMIYYAQGQIIATQDRPGNIIRQFSEANVVVEVDDNGTLTRPPFSYEGTGLKARKTVALVSWNDPDDRYKGKVEYVEDRDAIDRYGYRELEVRAFGCTSQSQAQRVGRWSLITNLNETETVAFKVGAEGFFLMPGEIIEIADTYKTVGIYAGMLEEISDDAVVLDRNVVLEEGKTYELTVRGSNGVDRTRTITSNPGQTKIITFSPSFNQIPELPAGWIIREAGVAPRKYRVIGLNEDDGIVTVLASSYYEDKYDLVDNSTFLSAQIRSIAGLNVVSTVNAGSIVLRTT